MFKFKMSHENKCLVARGLIILIIFFLFLVFGAFIWLKGSLPAINGEFLSKTVSQPVEIIRDKNAVPHIFAKNKEDAFFALGLTHAQDRLWQMELMRRTGSGRLSEILGRTALPFDKYTRTLGFYKTAQDRVGSLPPKLHHQMTAYVAGINYHINNHRGPLSPEFVLLRHRPEPWSIADSLVWSCMMAFQLSQNWWKELLRLRLSEKFNKPQIEDFWPRHNTSSAILNLTKTIFPNSAQLKNVVPEMFIPHSASNAWVVSGIRTDTGKPILANDPHLAFSAPSLWYLARIITPNSELVGATVPGTPITIIGHNKNIAWGLTTAGGDTQDLFIETLIPGQRNLYMTPQGARVFNIHKEQIKIRDQTPIHINVRSSRNGIIISDIVPTRKLLPHDQVLALQSTQMRKNDRTYEAMWQINRARNWDDFRTAAHLFHSPHQNIFFADRKGDIGMISSGFIPIRNGWDGRWPADGKTLKDAWIGTIPFDHLPQRKNPGSGFLGNANNQLVSETRKHTITKDWDAPYRAERLQQLAQVSQAHTLDTSAAWQLDSYSSAAAKLLPLMLAKLPNDLINKKAVDILRNWDFHMRRNSTAPLIYNAWVRNFMVHLMRPFDLMDLGPKPSFLILVLSQKPLWCDVQTTKNKIENCSAALEKSFRLTMKQLIKQNGNNIDQWRWGSKHKALFKHRIFDQVPLLRNFANLKISTSGGDHTLNRGQTNFNNNVSDPFLHRHGAGFRAIYDLRKLSRSRFITATGQSGNILSPHYKNFIRKWRDGSYINIAGTRDALKKSAVGVLRLNPKK